MEKIVYKGTDLVSADKKNKIRDLERYRNGVFSSLIFFPHKTVMDNVTMAPQLVSKMSKEDAEAKAEKYLKLVGMDHRKILIRRIFPEDSSSVFQLQERSVWNRN